jgi:NitT/TauT family transport system ATP-binding protein
MGYAHEEMRTLLRSEQRKTVLCIPRSIDEAVFLSDRVVVMILRPGGAREILDIELPRPRRARIRDSSSA